MGVRENPPEYRDNPPEYRENPPDWKSKKSPKIHIYNILGASRFSNFSPLRVAQFLFPCPETQKSIPCGALHFANWTSFEFQPAVLVGPLKQQWAVWLGAGQVLTPPDVPVHRPQFSVIPWITGLHGEDAVEDNLLWLHLANGLHDT